MRGLFTSQSIRLQAGEALSGRASQAQLLRVRSGRAWITIESDRHDYWLDAGDTLRLPADRLVVVEAQESMLEAAFEAQRQHGFASAGVVLRLLQRLRRGGNTGIALMATRP